jgi:hypothetical protein
VGPTCFIAPLGLFACSYASLVVDCAKQQCNCLPYSVCEMQRFTRLVVMSMVLATLVLVSPILLAFRSTESPASPQTIILPACINASSSAASPHVTTLPNASQPDASFQPSSPAPPPQTLPPLAAHEKSPPLSRNCTKLQSGRTCCVTTYAKTFNPFFIGAPGTLPAPEDIICASTFKLLADFHMGDLSQPPYLKPRLKDKQLNAEDTACLQPGVVLGVDSTALLKFYQVIFPQIKVLFWPACCAQCMFILAG